MKKRRDRIITVLLAAVLIVGVCLISYPTVANWWNSSHQTRVIETVATQVAEMSDEAKAEMLEAAGAYNEALLENSSRFTPTLAEEQEYQSLLNLSDASETSNVMGSITIPSINVALPIYHGTSETVLAAGAGHLEGSSLPVGGLGTHCVLTGHRGLPSAELFTRLDELEVGDVFVLNILDDQLTYQVDTIRIVLPSEISSLAIDPDQDLCTLVTCTPYGVNTHRILITGHRIANQTDYEINMNAKTVDSKIVALICLVPILVVLFIVLMITTRKKRKEEPEDDEFEDL